MSLGLSVAQTALFEVETVEFEWERTVCPGSQNGCSFCAVEVVPSR